MTLAFSPCPNDTFIFDAIVNKRIDIEGLKFETIIADVEELNKLAMSSALDITKMSYHAYSLLTDKYAVCESGSALGRGNGPLLVSKRKIYSDEIRFLNIAVPGQYTTATFLLKYAFPDITEPKIYLFSDIEDAVNSNEVDAGVLIHEGRFTYASKGLQLIADLGKHWEKTTKQAVPLGCIAVSTALSEETRRTFERVLTRSVRFAMSNPEASAEFVRKHAQEQEAEITRQHIALFVNEYTLALGENGHTAVNYFLKEAKRMYGLSE